MRTSYGFVVALLVAGIITAFGSRTVLAQGSPPGPVGGGWAYEVTRTDEGLMGTSKPILTWSWLRTTRRAFLPSAGAVLVWRQPWVPIAQGPHWWGVKAGR